LDAGCFVLDSRIRRGMLHAAIDQPIVIERPRPFGSFIAG
jgi:hypothetical protein